MRIHSGFAIAAALMIGVASQAQAAPVFAENFDNVAGLGGSGWVFFNSSTVGGSTGWFQGNDGVFPAQAGASNSYVAANFENAPAGGDIDNWLITPTMLLNDGDTVSFYTQSAGLFADRLEVRSSAGGALPTNFGNLLLTINPTLDPNGYPTAWTLYTVTMSGLGGPTTSRLAFRYFVPDTNTNANYIGIDTLSVDSNTTPPPTPVPEPGTLVLALSGLAAVTLTRRRAIR